MSTASIQRSLGVVIAHKEAGANARLIAKAPEMRAELERIRNLTVYNLRTSATKRDREAVAGECILRIDALLAEIDGVHR